MEKSLSMVLLFLATLTIASAKLVPLYDNGSPRKLFNVTEGLILGCTAPDMTKITWKKNDQSVDKAISPESHYSIIAAEGKFVINSTRLDDAGNYSCHYNDESHKFEVFSNVIVKVPKDIYVVENEKLEIVCIARGSDPEISWRFKNDSGVDEELMNEGRYQVVKLESGSKLIIEKAEMSDRGTYSCAGTNDAMREYNIGHFQSDGFVRVKDKLAALWPFLGICAEVLILCTIILIYEKRRNKTDLDESDTDQSPDHKK